MLLQLNKSSFHIDESQTNTCRYIRLELSIKVFFSPLQQLTLDCSMQELSIPTCKVNVIIFCWNIGMYLLSSSPEAS